MNFPEVSNVLFGHGRDIRRFLIEAFREGRIVDFRMVQRGQRIYCPGALYNYRIII